MRRTRLFGLERIFFRGWRTLKNMKRFSHALFAFCLSFTLALFFATPTLYASADEEDRRELPILMYHSVLTSPTGVYYITPQALEEDLAALTARGYKSVRLADVARYLKGVGSLPEKPVLITFDDGHYNNYFYAMEILKKQGFYAVLNVIGSFSEYSSTHEKDHPEYSHLTWDEIGILARSGVFEIGNHSYAMHAYKPRFGITQKKGESAEEYEKALKEDALRLEYTLLDKCGVRPVCYAYPFGAYSEESEAILRSIGYEAIFTCYERVNVLRKGDEKKLARLYRINRDGTLSTEAFLNKHKL